MPLQDEMSALRNLVLANTEIFALTGDRIFINAIPESIIEAQDPRQPQKMLVLRRAGGPLKADLLPVENFSINALCYGESDEAATSVLRSLRQFFIALKREIVDGMLFHHFNPSGGAIPLVDPDIVWPAVSQGFTFLADTKEA